MAATQWTNCHAGCCYVLTWQVSDLERLDHGLQGPQGKQRQLGGLSKDGCKAQHHSPTEPVHQAEPDQHLLWAPLHVWVLYCTHAAINTSGINAVQDQALGILHSCGAGADTALLVLE